MKRGLGILGDAICRNVSHLLASFRYSLDGFRTCFRDETAFRQEIAAGILHFSLIFSLQPPLVAAVFLTVLYALLLAVELINTAIEAAIDCSVVGRNPLAKKAKDCASAAVFCIISVFVATWFVVLSKMFRIWELFQ